MTVSIELLQRMTIFRGNGIYGLRAALGPVGPTGLITNGKMLRDTYGERGGWCWSTVSVNGRYIKFPRSEYDQRKEDRTTTIMAEHYANFALYL